MAEIVRLAIPLPSSPVTGEVLTASVGHSASNKLDRNTSPLAGEDGRGARQ